MSHTRQTKLQFGSNTHLLNEERNVSLDSNCSNLQTYERSSQISHVKSFSIAILFVPTMPGEQLRRRNVRLNQLM